MQNFTFEKTSLEDTDFWREQGHARPRTDIINGMVTPPRILHITPHLGGGCGKVLSALAIEDDLFCHDILCLEPTQNEHFVQLCRSCDIRLLSGCEVHWKELLEQYDLIQVEWWHHPLTAQWLVETAGDIPMRLLLWSHISGCNYPLLPYKLIEVSSAFIFASPYSLENPSWSDMERQQVIADVAIVPSSGNRFDMPLIRNAHDGFHIGYIGFLGYDKLHPAFVRYCEACQDIPGVHFTIAGELKYGEQLVRDIAVSPVSPLVTFAGYLTDPQPLFCSLDVLLYPLQPSHTATTENTLLEAMAAGVVPVVLDQCSERYTITHLQTGMVVHSDEEAGKAVQWLYEHPQERNRIGLAAAAMVREKFTLARTINGMHREYSRLLTCPRRLHDYRTVLGTTPYEWFCSCYSGDLSRITGLAAGPSKGSVHQFARYFPIDIRLRQLSEETKDESRV